MEMEWTPWVPSVLWHWPHFPVLTQFVCTRVCACGSHSSPLLLSTVYLIWERDRSFSSNLPSWLSTCCQAPGICWSPPPQHWGYKHESPYPGLFYMVLGLNSGPPHGCTVGTLPTKPSSQPLWDISKTLIPSLPRIVLTVPCSVPFSVRKTD